MPEYQRYHCNAFLSERQRVSYPWYSIHNLEFLFVVYFKKFSVIIHRFLSQKPDIIDQIKAKGVQGIVVNQTLN